MVFKSDQEQKKWDQIQKAASMPIDKMLQGDATPDDLDKLAQIVEAQNELAGKAFKEGIASAEATADAIVDKLNQDRIATGKRPLTNKAQDRIFKQTFQKVLQASTEDILGAVQDRLDEQEENDGERHTEVMSALNKVKSPEPTPAKEKEEPVDSDEVAEKVSRSISDRFKAFKEKAKEVAKSTGHGVQAFSRNALNAVKHPKASTQVIGGFIKSAVGDMRDSVVNGWQQLTKKKDTDKDDDEDKKSETWLRKVRSFFGDKFGAVKSKAKKAGGLLKSIFGPIGKVLLLALTNPQLITTVTQAVSKYLNFESIETFLAATWKEVKDGGGAVVEWIIDKVKETWNPNYKNAVPKTAADNKVIDASVAKNSAIPVNTTVAEAKAAIPDIEDKIKATQRTLATAQADVRKDPSDKNKYAVSVRTQRLHILQGQLANYQAVANGSTKTIGTSLSTGGGTTTMGASPSATATPSLAQVASTEQGPPVPTDNKPGSTKPGTSMSGPTSTTTLQGPSPAAVLASSSVPANATTTKTEVISAKPAVYKEGVTVQPPAPATTESKPRPATGTTPGVMSLGSFGFSSGDDTLNILNMGLAAS